MKQLVYIIQISILFICTNNVNAQKRFYFDEKYERCDAAQAYIYRDVTDNGTKYKIKEYYAANDQLKSTGSYLGKTGTDEERDGNFEFFHSNGKQKATVKFKNGKEEGDYISYFENGKLEAKGKYTGGKQNGDWETYYDNGQLKSKGRYFIGKYDSDWIWYYEDGKIEQETRYKQGIKDGFHKTYYKNGKPSLNCAYDGDSLVGYYYEWWEDGKDAAFGKYFNNKRDSIWNWFHQNGKLACKVMYTKGELDNGTFYNEEGEEMSKRVRSTKDLIKLPQYKSGNDGIWEVINDKIVAEVNLKDVKKGKVMVKVLYEINLDKEGKVTETKMLSPNPNEPFSDPYKVIENIKTAIEGIEDYTPKRAYNRYVESTIYLSVVFDGFATKLSLTTVGLAEDE